MIEGVVQFFGELWAILVGMWTAFSGILQSFADMGLTPVVEMIEGYCSSGGNCTEATALSTAFAGVYVILSTAPGLVLAFFVLKSIIGDVRKAIVGVVGYKALSVGVMGYYLGIRPTPDQAFAALSYGPVTVYDSVLNLFQTGDMSQIFATGVTFLAFFAMAWAMFYVINLLTYFVGILARPNPPWSNSSGKGHALLYTIAWLFFMTMSTPAAAFVNVMILNIVVLWRRAEWREKRRENGAEFGPDDIASAVADATGNSSSGSSDDSPQGTERIDYRK